jgi:hypothetical protein
VRSARPGDWSWRARHLNAIVTGAHPQSILYELASDGPEGGKAIMIREIVNSFRAMARQQVKQTTPALASAILAHQVDRAAALAG